jgi:hypothetical protein
MKRLHVVSLIMFVSISTIINECLLKEDIWIWWVGYWNDKFGFEIFKIERLNLQ